MSVYLNPNNLTPNVSHSSPIAPAGYSPGVGAAPQSKSGVPFNQLMMEVLQEVDQPQQTATNDMNKLLKGEVNNIHEVAINAAKADIAFRMVMEVRDKLISAYQDVMRMQI
ncbi:flagellar hook-basal body complex protein FliE [Planctomicrobium sp. SH668]|uniref:flagellar hook-basal body complex protein FliE n=1 Tax=Planctomicrobium sp. SH668 TaxID=3448126 RepID=UPI003F5C8782